MTVKRTMEKINEMEEHTRKMKKDAFDGVSSRSMTDEITITYGDLVNMLCDREELIAIHKRMVKKMKIDEAIEHCEEKVREQEYYAKFEKHNTMIQACSNCADEHRQLAEWLKELKDYRAKAQSLQEEYKKGYDKGYDQAEQNEYDKVQKCIRGIKEWQQDVIKYDFVFDRIYEIIKEKMGCENEM